MNSLPILTIGIVLLASCGINLKKRGLMIDRTRIERTRKTSSLEDESRESVRSIKNQESILYSDSSSTSSILGFSLNSERKVDKILLDIHFFKKYSEIFFYSFFKKTMFKFELF